MVAQKDRIIFSRRQLQWIMVISMLADHIACIFLDPLYVSEGAVVGLPFRICFYILHLMGRISFPLVCFLLVEGIRHTHDWKKYILRMAVFAFLSEIPFDLAINGKLVDMTSQNILFTLLIGLGMLVFLEQASSLPDILLRTRVNVLVVVASAFLAFFVRCDYSFWGIFLILLLYQREVTGKKQFFFMLLLCVCQGVIEVFAATALFLISHYDGRLNKQDSFVGGGSAVAVREPPFPLFQRYFFYLFYPLHMLILWGIRNAL